MTQIIRQIQMGQSLIQNYIHIIFSTKNREPLIFSEYEDRLHGYLATVCNDFGCTPIIIGGYNDHIHILCLLSKNIALSTLLQKIKSNSSRWIKTLDPKLENFAWQKGYGAFSVNPTEKDIVKKYIANQHEHHSNKTFQQEYLQFLKKYNVEYDERYVWE